MPGRVKAVADGSALRLWTTKGELGRFRSLKTLFGASSRQCEQLPARDSGEKLEKPEKQDSDTDLLAVLLGQSEEAAQVDSDSTQDSPNPAAGSEPEEKAPPPKLRILPRAYVLDEKSSEPFLPATESLPLKSILRKKQGW